MKVRTKAPFTVKYMEFLELLFGTSEKGLIYFDATTYIAEKVTVRSIRQLISPESFLLVRECKGYLRDTGLRDYGNG